MSSLRRLSHRQARRAAIALFASFAALSPARAENLVTVRASVDHDYAARRAAVNPPAPEKYVVMKGKFFSGTVYNRTLQDKKFADILKTLAHDLKRKQYIPAKDPNDADLMLMVHWGVTEDAQRHYDQGNRDIQTLNSVNDRKADVQAGAADMAAGDSANASQYETVAAMQTDALQAEAEFSQLAMLAETAGYSSISGSNSKMLGFSAAMENDNHTLFGSEKNATLRSMAEEERYFIIVLAFDMRHPPKGKGKPSPVWVVRMSERAAGINFDMALQRISETGGRIYGESTDGIAFEKPSKRREKIEYGDMQVIEVK